MKSPKYKPSSSAYLNFTSPFTNARGHFLGAGFGSSVGEPAAGYARPHIPDFHFPDIRPVLDFFGFTLQETARLFDLDPSTLSRRRKSAKPIGPLRSKLILDLDVLAAKGIRIFGSESAFSAWLRRSNAALGGASPASYLRSAAGIAPVSGLLDTLSWGNFS